MNVAFTVFYMDDYSKLGLKNAQSAGHLLGNLLRDDPSEQPCDVILDKIEIQLCAEQVHSR